MIWMFIALHFSVLGLTAKSNGYQEFILHYNLSTPRVMTSSHVTLTFKKLHSVSIPLYKQQHKSSLSACIPTLYKVHVKRVSEWINFYIRQYSLNSVNLYVNKQFPDVNRGFLESNLIRGHNFSIDYVVVPPLLLSHRVFYYGQSLAVLDCLIKSMFDSRVLFQDLDEFLVLEPGITLDFLLNRTNTGAVTFGSRRYSTEFCTEPYVDPPSSMPIASSASPECDIEDARRNAGQKTEIANELCLMNAGRRKHVVNPSG
ncbi:hypothetical protein RCL1_007382 [Eukaryota sp. TZLM3-RCL]